MAVTVLDLQTWSKIGAPSNGAANLIDFDSGSGQQYVYEASLNIPAAGSYEFVVDATSVEGWNAGKKMVWVTADGGTGFDWTNSVDDWDGELDGSTDDQTLRLPFTTTGAGNISVRVGPGATSSGNQLSMTIGASIDDLAWAVSSVDDDTPQAGDTIRISGSGFSGSGMTVADSEGNAWTVTAQTATYVDVIVPDIHAIASPVFDYGEAITLTVTDGGDSGTIDATVSAKTGDFYGTLTVGSGSFAEGSLFETALGVAVSDKAWVRETTSTGAVVDPADGTFTSVENGAEFDYAFYDESEGEWSAVFSKTITDAVDSIPDPIVLEDIDDAEISAPSTTDLDFSNITRASGQWALDYAGRLQYYPDDVEAYIGRRNGGVNLYSAPEDLEDAYWSKTAFSVTPGIADPDGGNTAFRLTATSAVAIIKGQNLSVAEGTKLNSTWWIRRESGSAGLRAYTGNASVSVNVTGITSEWQELVVAEGVASSGTNISGLLFVSASGDIIDVWHPALTDVTAHLNPYIPYSDIGQSHLTTNPSYVDDDGVLHSLVGCAIADRPDFDGTQLIQLGEDLNPSTGEILFFEIADFTTTGTKNLFGHDDGAESSNSYVRSDSGTLVLRGGDGVFTVDGESTSTLPLDGSPHRITVSGFGANDQLFSQFCAHVSGATSCSIYNVGLIGSDGTLKHFWRGGPTDAHWRDQVGGNHGTIVNGPLAVLPNPDRGVALRPEATEVLGHNRDFSQWVVEGTASVTTDQIAGPDGQIKADLISVNDGGNRVYKSSNGQYPQYAKYSPAFFAQRVSTSGILLADNPASETAGRWEIDMALLSNGLEWITENHPSVTVVSDFVGFDAANKGGLLFKAKVAGELSFYCDIANTFTAGIPSTPIINETSGSVIQAETIWTESIDPVTNDITVTVEGFWPFDAADAPGGGVVFSVYGPSTNILRCQFSSGQLLLVKYVGGAYSGAASIVSPSFANGDAFKIVASMSSKDGISIDLNNGAQTSENAELIGDFSEPANSINIGSDRVGNNVLPLNVTSASYETITGNIVQFNPVVVSGIDAGVEITPVLTGNASDIEWSVNGGSFGTSATVSEGDELVVRAAAPTLYSDQPDYVQSTVVLDLNGVTAQGNISTRINDTPVLPNITITLSEDAVVDDVVVDLGSYLNHNDASQEVTYTSSDLPLDFAMTSAGVITMAVNYDALAEDLYAFVVEATDDSGAPTAEGPGAVIVLRAVATRLVSFYVNGRIARRWLN